MKKKKQFLKITANFFLFSRLFCFFFKESISQSQIMRYVISGWSVWWPLTESRRRFYLEFPPPNGEAVMLELCWIVFGQFRIVFGSFSDRCGPLSHCFGPFSDPFFFFFLFFKFQSARDGARPSQDLKEKLQTKRKQNEKNYNLLKTTIYSDLPLISKLMILLNSLWHCMLFQKMIEHSIEHSIEGSTPYSHIDPKGKRLAFWRLVFWGSCSSTFLQKDAASNCSTGLDVEQLRAVSCNTFMLEQLPQNTSLQNASLFPFG